MATRKSDKQDASSSDEPATLDPTAKRLLDKPMTPNQPPPITHDTHGARDRELHRQREVAQAVKDANRDVLPTLGGDTWASPEEDK